MSPQENLFPDGQTPKSGREAGRQSLDQLFTDVSRYRNSREYYDVLQFVAKLSSYAPYNNFLLYTQNPSVTFVATADQWLHRHGRTVRRGARPLVILAPMSPVLFVYDLIDTEGAPVSEDILRPFAVRGCLSEAIWHRTLLNATATGIAVLHESMTHTQAGYAQRLENEFHRRGEKLPPVRFKVALKDVHTLEERYATLVHELGHILAGHLGELKSLKISDRRKHLDSDRMELEAESINYLVCKRVGLETSSAAYLAAYAQRDSQLPEFSLDTVLHVAGLIERWGRENPKRKAEKGT